MGNDHSHNIAFVVDVLVALTGWTAGMWITLLESSFHWFFLVGGAVLLMLRILIARRDWKEGRRDGEKE